MDVEHVVMAYRLLGMLVIGGIFHGIHAVGKDVGRITTLIEEIQTDVQVA